MILTTVPRNNTYRYQVGSSVASATEHDFLFQLSFRPPKTEPDVLILIYYFLSRGPVLQELTGSLLHAGHCILSTARVLLLTKKLSISDEVGMTTVNRSM